MAALRPLLGAALLLGLLSTGVQAQESAPVPPVVEAATDAALPTGYRSVTWGATPDIVQGIRGRVMESLSTPDPHITYLIDAPRPGETELREVVKWKFWDDQLVEVHIHYEGPFTRKEGREIVSKFQRKYGDGKHEQIFGATSPNQQRPPLLEEWWTWEDSFSIQVLRQEVSDQSWVAIRHSRLLEAARRAQEEREREEARTRRVKAIELD